jgi:hypothetical protein
MLGECQSKCEHIRDAPILPDTAKELFQLYLAKGVVATTAIEGNTITEKEALEHIKGKLRLPPSREYQGREIAELPQLVRVYRNPASGTLKNDINELVREGLLVKEKGKIRARFEAISGFKNIAV